MDYGSDDSIPTRHSLLSRLKHWDDQESWRDFFDTYWKLIYGVAIKSGMSDVEAQEVVQETVIAVAKKIPEFKTDPAFGSFKAWLLHLTRWRIADPGARRFSRSAEFIPLQRLLVPRCQIGSFPFAVRGVMRTEVRAPVGPRRGAIILCPADRRTEIAKQADRLARSEGPACESAPVARVYPAVPLAQNQPAS